jgi:hypothetical protein
MRTSFDPFCLLALQQPLSRLDLDLLVLCGESLECPTWSHVAPSHFEVADDLDDCDVGSFEDEVLPMQLVG